MHTPKTPIPVILGTTATGKTSVGIELAKHIKGEIISVDSRKVYQGLPIGTATPQGTWQENTYIVKGIPHHLMGHLLPDQPYTAGDFAKDAERLMDDILTRGKIPILVGGTGFYFKSLAHGLPPLPPPDPAFRAQCEKLIAANGLASLYQKLSEIDPIAAKQISSEDRHKIIRALEIFHRTQQPFSAWKDHNRKKSKHDFIVMGLDIDREISDTRIETRSQAMLANGMIEETQGVLSKGFSKTCPALVSFGFKEAVQVIEKTLTRDQFLEKLIKGTKAYANRQRTWFRTQIVPHWFKLEKNLDNANLSLKMKDFLNSPHEDLIYSPRD